MRFAEVAAALLPLAAAVPTKRQAAGLSANDVTVLQFAHYLENLEYTLYSGGYNSFTEAQYEAAGFPAGFRDNVGLTAKQEATHRDALAAVLTSDGVTPLPACNYQFPYTDVKSFVSLANMVTSVGIGAYLGGAGLIMDNAKLLTTAASILTVEARHNSYLRAGEGVTPYPTPFDTSLPAEFAYTLAHAFIVSCPAELPKPFTVLPPLNLTAPATGATSLAFTWDSSKFLTAQPASTQLYIAMINQVGAPVYAPVGKAGDNAGTVPVPAGVAGVAFAALTTLSSGAEKDLVAATLGLAEVALS